MLYHHIFAGLTPFRVAAVLTSRQHRPSTRWLDRLGIGVSAFCLLQCLALPVALVFAPAASAGFFSHEVFHLLLLGVIVPVSLVAFGLGFMRHRNARMWIPAGAGFFVLMLAAGLEQSHVLGPVWIALLTSVGSVCLIVGHLLNLRESSARRRA